MKKLLLSVALALMLVLSFSTPVFAATSQEVTITVTPGFISIANAPSAWTINDVADETGKYILVNIQYWSNPLGDTTSPSDPVVDGECRFTITNTSTIPIDLTVNFPDHTGGDASTNSDAGTNGATTFGAYSYCTGMTYSTGKVIAKSTGSDPMKEDLAATTDILWGLSYLSQTDDWTGGTNMTSAVVILATAS